MSATPAQEKYHVPNPVVRYVLRRFFDRIQTTVAGVAPDSILDAGCGEGELMRRGVLPNAVPVTWLDLNPVALQYFRTHSTQKDMVCGSLRALPFGDARFDAVLCLEVLEHLPDPASVVRELSRVARKAVILSVPHEPYFRIGNFLRGKYLSHWGDYPEHIHHWNFRTFGALLEPQFHQVRLIDAFPWIIACCGVNPHA